VQQRFLAPVSGGHMILYCNIIEEEAAVGTKLSSEKVDVSQNIHISRPPCTECFRNISPPVDARSIAPRRRLSLHNQTALAFCRRLLLYDQTALAFCDDVESVIIRPQL
jgi:hypothetical protein